MYQFISASLRKIRVFLTACLLFCSAFASLADVAAAEAYFFGWYPGDSLSMDENRATIFAKYLSDRSRLHIEAKKTGNVAELLAGLQKDTIHFAAIPNYQYPELHSTLHLLATPQYNSDTSMHLYIIAHSGAGINTIEDLKGKSAGQVMESNKLKCYFLAESLKNKPQDFLGKVTVFQNVKEAVDNVASGKVLTTCISSTAYEILSKFDPSLAQKVKIIKRSAAYALDPVVASTATPEDVRWNLQSTLINMGNDYAAQQILLPMGFHGFASPINDLALYPRSPERTKQVDTPSAAVPISVENAESTEAPAIQAKEPPEARPIEQEQPQTVQASPPPTPPQQESTAKPPVPSLDAREENSNGMTPASEEALRAQKLAQEALKEQAARPQEPAGPVITQGHPEEKAVTSTQTQDEAGRPRSWYTRYQYQVAGVILVLVIVIGLTAVSMLGNIRKGKMLTVLFMMNGKLTAMQSHLDWRGKLCLQVCETVNALNEHGIRKILRDIGHKGAMKIAVILNSDRLIFREYTFPLLKGNEVNPAVHWRLKDMNIPYNEDSDTIHTLVIARDRQAKEMTVQAIIVPDNDQNAREWKQLNLGIDTTVCMEMALLNRYRQNLPEDDSGRALLAYRLNEQEAIVLLLDGSHSFITRRIFGSPALNDFQIPAFSLELEREPAPPEPRNEHGTDPAELWKNFLPDIQQTISFYSRQSGRALDTLYLAGQEVPLTPDPENELADKLGIKVAPIDLLADIDLRPGVREGCPAVEILAGAAMLWHKKC